MKRYFIALFILPLLLVACDDDKLEMMPPLKVRQRILMYLLC